MKATLVSTRRSVVRLFIMLLVSVGIFAADALANASVHTILPGIVWKDVAGNLLEAHGEGLIKVGSTYYMIGEDKTSGALFQNVNCYSTPDLTTFTFVGHLLTLQGSGDLGPNRIVERPHVIFNSSTNQYVMYMHIDNTNYSERKTGVATSSTVCGTYTYRGSFKPLGHDSLDDNLFVNGTTGYFMSEDRTNQKLQLYQLSADYLSVSSLVATLNQYEGPALVKIGSNYFMFGSHLTGWATNDNQYTHATSLSGPWSAWQSFAPAGTNTCNSQSTSILTVAGSSTTSYVFLGDRWNSSNLSDSRYIWEPLNISGTTMSISCYDSWTIDTATGAVVTPPDVNDNTLGTGQNQFNYTGTWSYGAQSGAFQGDNHWSSTTNNAYQVQFTGTQVKIYSAKNSNHGIFAVSIDGGSESNVDLYAGSRSDQVLVWTSPTLTRATHTVKVRVTGTKNASSSGTAIVADRVSITP